jgi:hypothetical protein
MRAHTGQILPDVGCPEPIIDAWKATCQIPLFPGKWNTWAMARHISDELPRHEIVDRAHRAFRFWFREGAAIPRVTLGNADNWSGELVGSADLFPSAAAVQRRIAVSVVDCALGWDEQHPDHKVSLKGRGFAVVVVRFVYRGSETSMPWPSVRQTALPAVIPPQLWQSLPGVVAMIAGSPHLSEWCPSAADWLVTAVYEPDPSEPVPAPGSWVPTIPGVGPAAEKVASTWSNMLIAGAVAGGVVLTIALLRATR